MENPATKIYHFTEDPAISKGTKAFLSALNNGGPGLETLTTADARQVLIGAQKSVEIDYSGIEESEKNITADGFEITLNIVKPADTIGTLPVFIFIHGGGWILGDYPTHKRMVKDLVVLSGAAGVFINYTPSPEAHYPQAIDEFLQPQNGLPQMALKLALMVPISLSSATALAVICRRLLLSERKKIMVQKSNYRF